MFEKMTKDLTHVLFWGPKWPGNWASESDIQHTSKSSSNWHVHQDWCETSGKFLRKWLKIGIFTYLGPKVAQNCSSELDLWGPYFPHRWKYLQRVTILMWNQWKIFEKWPKSRFWKWSKNWAFEAHIVHLSQSSSNEHIKQDRCESRGNITK